MPVYEYVCDKCGSTTETLRRMADADAPQACDRCGSTKTKRAHSVFCCSGDGAPDAMTPASSRHVHSGSCGCGRGACGM